MTNEDGKAKGGYGVWTASCPLGERTTRDGRAKSIQTRALTRAIHHCYEQRARDVHAASPPGFT